LCCLSRSTLLYYSNIGILAPRCRTEAGYRIYSENDRVRLEKIITFRSLGIELKKIKDLLELENQKPLGILLKRIFQINDSIIVLRKQQKEILDILELDNSHKIGKSAFKSRLPVVFDEEPKKIDFKHIHSVFEQCSPEEHKRLLDLLGFSESESQELMKEITTST
jgi:DNA-binding transcriptional MerR regulator